LKTAAIESAGLTDVGKLRNDNEDALLVDDELGLYVVADGMGGHRAGEVASKLVIESIQDYLSKDATGEDAQDDTLRDASLSTHANRVLAGIEHANKVVYQAALNEEAFEGMGSTVSMLLFAANTLVAANVGDSPIYLIHNQKLQTLSIPHTVMAEQMAIDPEAAAELGSEYHHMLTQAMGANLTVDANICEIPYFKGDILVIGSDGLTDLVNPEETLEIAIKAPPESACRQMVDLANDRGGLDNITVIVVQIHATGNGSPKIKKLMSRVISRIFNKTPRQEK
jgi:protein phosphatase